MEDNPTPNPADDERLPDEDPTGDDWWSNDSRPSRPRGAGARSPRAWIGAGVGALAIAVAAVVGVNAVTSGSSASTTTSAAAGPGANGRGPGGQGAAGTISSINGSSISLTATNGKKTTVVTSGSTAVDEALSGSLTDVKVGDHVAVMGSTSGTTVIAQQITDSGTKTLPGPPGGANGQQSGPPSGSSGQQGGPPSGSSGRQGGPPSGASSPGAGGGRPTVGTVESTDGSTVTVKTSSGSTVTVTTSSSTKVMVIKTGALSDLKVGDRIVVSGTTSDGTITATTIRTGSAGLGGGPGGGSGPAGGNGQGSGPGQAPSGS